MGWESGCIPPSPNAFCRGFFWDFKSLSKESVHVMKFEKNVKVHFGENLIKIHPDYPLNILNILECNAACPVLRFLFQLQIPTKVT